MKRDSSFDHVVSQWPELKNIVARYPRTGGYRAYSAAKNQAFDSACVALSRGETIPSDDEIQMALTDYFHI